MPREAAPRTPSPAIGGRAAISMGCRATAWPLWGSTQGHQEMESWARTGREAGSRGGAGQAGLGWQGLGFGPHGGTSAGGSPGGGPRRWSPSSHFNSTLGVLSLCTLISFDLSNTPWRLSGEALVPGAPASAGPRSLFSSRCCPLTLAPGAIPGLSLWSRADPAV